MMKKTPRPVDPKKPRNLSGVQFRYFPPQGRDRYHSLTAFNKDDAPLASLSWSATSGKIDMIRTHPDYRGLGVATTMLERAHKLAADTGIKAPKHSEHRTHEGEAWAKSTGDKLPKRKCMHCGKNPAADSGFCSTCTFPKGPVVVQS